MTLPPRPCPYLPGRTATDRAFLAGSIEGAAYEACLDAGFRRSGRVIYQPVCVGCGECRPLRVVVDTFRPSKSQRRCERRNADVRVMTGRPIPTDEKYALYTRYLRDWHRRDDVDAPDAFEEFLYGSPHPGTQEMTYRDSAGRLLSVGIVDVGPTSLSSVYVYFDPAERRRGLGTLAALREIDACRSLALAFYHLGFWIRDAATMRYKADYRPHELLDACGQWVAPIDTAVEACREPTNPVQHECRNAHGRQ